MLEHVHARCGDFHLLFPTENIGVIDTRFKLPGSRRTRTDPNQIVIDLRRLLGTPIVPAEDEGVATLEWRSTDGRRRALLTVDAVEEIVRCSPADLIAAPFLPPRLRPLCDCVMRGPDGRFHLRVRLDVPYRSTVPRPQSPPVTAFSSDLNRLGDFLNSSRAVEATLREVVHT
jgi:hypothetical protein